MKTMLATLLVPIALLISAEAISSLQLAVSFNRAMAQGRTVYGADGRPIARSTIDSQGTTTLYGADGRALTRETTTRNGTNIYDAQSGRALGKATRESGHGLPR